MGGELGKREVAEVRTRKGRSGVEYVTGMGWRVGWGGVGGRREAMRLEDQYCESAAASQAVR